MKKLIVCFTSMALIAGVASAAGNFVHDSRSVAYVNASSAITAGNLVDLGDRYGVALVDIASNATGTVQIDGVWSFARANTNAIAAGAAVYYNTASNVTGTAAAEKYIGQCTEAVAVCTALTNSVGEVSKFVKVDLNACHITTLAGDISPTGVTSNLATIVSGGTTSTLTIVSGRITAITP